MLLKNQHMNSKATLWGLPGDIVTGCKINDTAIWRIFINLPAGRQGRTLFFTFILTFIFLNSSNAQNDNPAYFTTVTPEKVETLVQEGWKGAYLDAAGMNIKDGVVLFSLLKKCGAEDFILLQMINNNDYDVRVFWKDAVYTKERKLIDGETLSDSDEKSIIIKANSEVIGDCSKEHPQLIFNSKNFIDDPDNFNRYAPSSFEVTLE